MAGQAALGTVISIGSTIINVTGFDGPSSTADTVDVSSFSTTTSREYIQVLSDGGEMTVNVNYDADLHDVVADLVKTATAQSCTITYANTAATVTAFSAFVTGFSPSGELDGALTATITLKVTGDVDWDDAV